MFLKRQAGLGRACGWRMIRTGESVKKGGRIDWRPTPCAGHEGPGTAEQPSARGARSRRFFELAGLGFMSLQTAAGDSLRDIGQFRVGLRLGGFHGLELRVPLLGIVTDLGFQIRNLGAEA